MWVKQNKITIQKFLLWICELLNKKSVRFDNTDCKKTTDVLQTFPIEFLKSRKFGARRNTFCGKCCVFWIPSTTFKNLARYFWNTLYTNIGDNELNHSRNNVKAIFFIRHAVVFFACQSIIGTSGTLSFCKCNCIHFEMLILVINIETNYEKKIQNAEKSHVMDLVPFQPVILFSRFCQVIM